MPKIEWMKRLEYFITNCNHCGKDLKLYESVAIITTTDDFGIKKSVELVCVKCGEKVKTYY